AREALLGQRRLVVGARDARVGNDRLPRDGLLPLPKPGAQARARGLARSSGRGRREPCCRGRRPSLGAATGSGAAGDALRQFPRRRGGAGVKVLVTGGAGFIGSNLVRALLERGDDVRVRDNLSTGSRTNLAGLEVEVVEGELRSYQRV